MYLLNKNLVEKLVISGTFSKQSNSLLPVPIIESSSKLSENIPALF